MYEELPLAVFSRLGLARKLLSNGAHGYSKRLLEEHFSDQLLWALECLSFKVYVDSSASTNTG